MVDLKARGPVEEWEPAVDAEEVSPHDTNDIEVTRGVYVGTGGDMKVDMASGTTVTFAAVVGGSVLPIRVTRIYDTDTDADDIVALR